MRKKIGYVHFGISHQVISFYDFKHYIDDLIYYKDLNISSLSEYQVIIIADYRGEIYQLEKILNAFIGNGGFLIAFACNNIEKYIKSIDAQYIDKPIDWLSWKNGQKPPVSYPYNKDHTLFQYIKIEDMQWHWHGMYNVKNNNSVVLTSEYGHVLLDYCNIGKNNGRVMISTLDPHFHNGARFIPATTRFLQGFYKWLNHETGTKKENFNMLYIHSEGYGYNLIAGAKKYFDKAGNNILFAHLHDIDALYCIRNNIDIIFLPNALDQFILYEKQKIFLDYLSNNGQMIICTEPVISWMPFLSLFQSINPKPYTNFKAKIHNDPFNFYSNMPEDFDYSDGLLGLYSRGYIALPQNSMSLIHIEDRKTCDFLYQHNNAGKVYVHIGYILTRYPDHGDYNQGLLHDIACAMIYNRDINISNFI